MRRLSHQIWLTVVAVLVLFVVLVSFAWFLSPAAHTERDLETGVAETLAALLPGPERPARELQATLERVARPLQLDLAIFAADGTPLAAAGDGLPPPVVGAHRPRLGRQLGRGFVITWHLPDGRFVVARRPHGPAQAHAFLFGVLGLLGVALALGAWPLTRRLTGRLERLRRGVEGLGQGNLAARVPVEGRDEIAGLAQSFNRAAERIEALVGSQRRMLAFASHELRSPLARLRVSLEMLAGETALKAGAARDIAELDGLIGELLETSRVEATGADRTEDVDVLALVAEEAARVGAEVTGRAALVKGDARLLRRLVRNLLENARRHGGGTAIEATVAVGPEGGARIEVADRGRGVGEAERERIFEPFYRPAGSAETGEGYGLGLALVRQIARAHAGDAHCLPRAGGGSVFTVTLG
jgi:signal transduction histidine kinase